jgi:hypothetical protein
MNNRHNMCEQVQKTCSEDALTLGEVTILAFLDHPTPSQQGTSIV